MSPSISSKCGTVESLRRFSKPDFDPLMTEHKSIKMANRLVHGSFSLSNKDFTPSRRISLLTTGIVNELRCSVIILLPLLYATITVQTIELFDGVASSIFKANGVVCKVLTRLSLTVCLCHNHLV